MMFANSSQQLPPECFTNETLLVYLIPEDQRSEWFYNSWQVIVITILFPVISAFAVIGNSALLFVIFKIREMRTITNIYLGNLAIADLAYASVSLFHYVLLYKTSHELLIVENSKSSILCILRKAVAHIFFFASFGFVALVSFERFLAVCFPLKYRTHNTKNRAIRYVALIWLIALITTCMILPNWWDVHKLCVIWDTNGTYDIFGNCESKRSVFEDLHDLIEAVYFFLAFGASVVFYIMIIQTLRRRATSSTLHTDRSIQLKAKVMRNQVARMVILNGAVFFLCQVPFQIYNLYTYSDNTFLTENQSYTLAWTARLLGSVNSSVNPIIYTAASSKYRQAFVLTFCRKVESNEQNKNYARNS